MLSRNSATWITPWVLLTQSYRDCILFGSKERNRKKRNRERARDSSQLIIGLHPNKPIIPRNENIGGQKCISDASCTEGYSSRVHCSGQILTSLWLGATAAAQYCKKLQSSISLDTLEKDRNSKIRIQEKIRTQNWKYDFYWMPVTFVPLSGQNIIRQTMVS